MVFMAILLILPTASASDCFTCQADYFKCRSEAAKNHADKLSQCSCVTTLSDCFATSQCDDDSQLVKVDGTYLGCAQPSPSQKEKEASLVTTPIAIVCVVGSLAFWVICCSVILIINKFRNPTRVESFPEKLVIVPSDPQDTDNGCTDDSKVCRICLENQKNTVFIPCGHICSCSECASKLDKCPICRAPITSIVKTFDV
ncbi:inhibitor of apoptosis 1, diap1, putative [Entamoeba invadens IP1]|uniref:Inhibitor of apoptosis 1, diap1, putative n=1 Tax=Entamoeba invadens IP1 TaxID=370355 RepID=A0A0A1U6Z3_ENTIV|nr:inhibitor of apoptosis 1, diap1, putative [Entamoeba invadens IP1]ELP87739.1 inhibitor of apoptosis 1, diap1, putative [Entamoeba invadens IP1]|eukprot:XP_004254510.1 inhibitor of apoptosis 1, diap1, putative [Entamoeba invadens IP1]